MFNLESEAKLVLGLLIGLLLRYTNIGVIESQTIDVMQKNRSVVRDPPDYLRLEVQFFLFFFSII